MIGDKIKELRKLNEITQQDLANKLGISFQALSNYENNRRTPSVELIKKLYNNKNNTNNNDKDKNDKDNKKEQD